MKTVLIEGSEGYYVREDGNVIGKTGVVLVQTINKRNGYHYVSIKVDGKFVTRRVHRLVAKNLIDNPNNLPEVNHIDGNKSNNHVNNLEWVTSSQNKRHSVDILGNNVGITHGMASITEEQVHEICKMLSSGYQNTYISEKLNVSVHIISDIRSRSNWTHISKDYKFPAKSRALSLETIEWVCRKLEAGMTPREVFEIAENEKLTLQVIRAIKERRNYKSFSEKYKF